jgi:hypothetical protein
MGGMSAETRSAFTRSGWSSPVKLGLHTSAAPIRSKDAAARRQSR